MPCARFETKRKNDKQRKNLNEMNVSCADFEQNRTKQQYKTRYIQVCAFCVLCIFSRLYMHFNRFIRFALRKRVDEKSGQRDTKRCKKKK